MCGSLGELLAIQVAQGSPRLIASSNPRLLGGEPCVFNIPGFPVIYEHKDLCGPNTNSYK